LSGPIRLSGRNKIASVSDADSCAFIVVANINLTWALLQSKQATWGQDQ